MIAIAADAFGTILTSDKPRTIRNKNLLLMPFLPPPCWRPVATLR